MIAVMIFVKRFPLSYGCWALLRPGFVLINLWRFLKLKLSMPPKQKLSVSDLEVELSRLFEAVWKHLLWYFSILSNIQFLILLFCKMHGKYD